MAQSEVGNKSVAKTVENNDEDEDFGPQLIGKLEVIIMLDRKTRQTMYNIKIIFLGTFTIIFYFLLICILRDIIKQIFILNF